MIDNETVSQFAQENNVPFSDFKSLCATAEVQSLVKSEIERINLSLAQAETLKKFRLIDKQLTVEDDELTASMKLKRNIVNEKYADLIDQMYSDKQEPKLGGVAGYHTAFFSDIQSFSAFSEVLEPERMVSLMNEYLTEMTNILLEHKGTLDKYIGDAIIAFYGAPVQTEDHEYLACLTCCQMNDKLEELRQKWKSEGDKWPEVVHNMRHRIGVNCGSLVTGNMGSDMRMNYTMMGDTVNLTARLESGAKQYGIETQVGSKIYEATKDRFTYRMLDYAVVKGRSEPERTFELISEKGKESEIYKELIPVWDKAIEFYTNQEWDKAIKQFKVCDNLEEDRIVVWWRWRESNPLHQIVYNYLILLDIIRLPK